MLKMQTWDINEFNIPLGWRRLVFKNLAITPFINSLIMLRHLVLFIIIINLAACSSPNQSAYELSEAEKWKLGWRMIESSWAENHPLVERQFDSLLNQGEVTEIRFLITGLEASRELGKEKKISKIVASLDKHLLLELCTRDLFKNNAFCSDIVIPAVENIELQLRLIRMYVDDQACRGNILDDLMTKYEITEDQIRQEDATAVDGWNRELLIEVIEKHGFPTKKLVGREAMSGVFYVIQHSDMDLGWQKSQLKNIENAVKHGDMDGERYAYLFDRIRINAGEHQRYGTQFKNVDFELGIAEIADTEDLGNLDSRRMEIGLMPIEVYQRVMLTYVN